MSTLNELAQQLKDARENIILIYAFNSTGKTRLSVEYKNITKNPIDGKHAGVYYNAYSEDLFVWYNDEENYNANMRLDILFSSLNQFHISLTEKDVDKKLSPYKPTYDFFFTPNKDIEKGFDSVLFYKKGDRNTPIKISRGEERIFIWCFFLALFEVDGWADKQNAHFFIDDPVSSLDDHNIFVTAASIFDLVEKQFEKKKIIITSHHFGILSILSAWLSKSSNSDKFRYKDKDGKWKNKFLQFILECKDEEFSLTSPNNGVFLYHLRLLQILDNAYKTEIYAFHFALLRQVLENIASFLGVGQFSYVLKQIGITNEQRIADIVNALSHQKVYYYQSDIVVEDNKAIFKEVFSKLTNHYNFVLHTD